MNTIPPESGPKRRPLTRFRQVFYIAFLLFAALFVYAISFQGMRFFRVPSDSMIPTLMSGDFIVTLPQQTYHRGDIVVLADPLMPGGYLVKRIVAVGGDTVDIGLGYLSVNGRYASEPYIREPINYALDSISVPENEVLVLGDNRNESDDASRWLIDPDTGNAKEVKSEDSDIVDGKRWKRTVPVETIVGKVAYRYLPASRIGIMKSFPLTNSAGE